MTLQELFEGRPIDVDEMMKRLHQVAEQEGLPLGSRRYTYNSRLAQELSKWAEYKGQGPAFHNAVFKAYFADGKNIGLSETLVEVAQSVGLSGGDAREVLEKRAFKEAVDMDWAIAKSMGITAVPTFVINKQGIVGAQPYEVLEKFLQDNQVSKREATSN
jgi:predicted DsbA family dithiol-disulfide isomerase